jgi:hypothetical protein
MHEELEDIWAQICRIVSQIFHAVVISAENASQRFIQEVDADGWYQDCSNYLKVLGVDNRAEIARILDISTNPRSLYHTFRDKKREGNSLVRTPLSYCIANSYLVILPTLTFAVPDCRCTHDRV